MISLSLLELHLIGVNLNLVPLISGSHGSPVGVAAGYGLNDRGFRVPVPLGSRIFSSTCPPDLI
jgi:hypothetical protein